MSCRGISTIGRAGVAALVALAFPLLALPAVASAADGGISGKVTFEGGGAVAGAEVCVNGGIELGVGCTLSEADGSYLIDNLEPGDFYSVKVEATESSPYVVFKRRLEEVTVTSGSTTSGIDVAVVKGGAMGGAVADASTGLPLGEVEVTALWEPGETFDGGDETDGNGSFGMIGLNPGPHLIEFWSWSGEYKTRFLNVTVTPGTTINANAFLVRKPPPEGRISGHVYALATKQPLAGVAVCAIDEFEESRGCAHTSNTGAYEFVDVPAEPWKIAFSPTPSEFEALEPGEIGIDAWPTQFWNMKPTLAQADVINLEQGAVGSGIDGLLGPGSSSLTSGGSSLPSPRSSPPPAAVAVTPKPKPLHCGKGKVKKRLKGKLRCVKRHKPRHHRHRNHR